MIIKMCWRGTIIILLIPTPPPQKKNSLSLSGMCFEVTGTLLGIGVYTVFYTILVQDKVEDCSDGERQPDKAMRATFRYHALTLGILTFFFILTTFIGVREQQGQLVSRFRAVYKSGLIPTKNLECVRASKPVFC